MKLNNYPLGKKENIIVQETDGEVLLYDLSDNKAYCLNETSAAVWELCDGKSSVADINEKLGKKMKQSTKEELVWLAIDQLKKEKLLTNHKDIIVDYNGLSRREAVKRVGLASLVALPIIMAITSPVAAAVASCAPGGQAGAGAAPGQTVTVTGAASSGTCFALLPAECCSAMVNFPSRTITMGPPAPFDCTATCA